VLLGWAFAGEPLTKGTAIAAAVILAGVALISTSQGKTSQGKPAAESKMEEEEPVLAEAEAEVCASR
jgi:drug/metabolite transporter (DMT)-like permease